MNTYFDACPLPQKKLNTSLLSTHLQSKSLVWIECRKGKITASVFGAVCRMSLSNPSQSLINSILQVSTPPLTASIQWGIENEERARSEYKAQAMNCHANLELRTTGLHVNPRFPHLGASPDGLVSCRCCGKGLLEIVSFQHSEWYSSRSSLPSASQKQLQT